MSDDDRKLPTWGEEQAHRRRAGEAVPLAELELLENLSRDAYRKRVESMAADLYRDRLRIAGIVHRLRAAGLDTDDLVIVAPARGGRLKGGTFLGLPLVEADVALCMVAVGSSAPPPVVADTTAGL